MYTSICVQSLTGASESAAALVSHGALLKVRLHWVSQGQDRVKDTDEVILLA